LYVTDEQDSGKRSRRNVSLALVHVVLALLVLAGFVYAQLQR
jgi:hypothetical protein